MSALSLDSFLIAKQPNIRYLTGFTGDHGYIVVTADSITFFTSKLYEEQARSIENGPVENGRITFVTVKESFIAGFSDFDISFWGEKIGFEAEVLTVSVFRKLSEKLKFAELIPAPGIIEELREKKDPSELRSITESQKITDRVFKNVLTLIKPGVEERNLACEIDYQFRKNGGEGSAFDTIVASGPNTSKPHAIPSDRKIETGDLILFDMGTVLDGYASDMTRTVVLGNADTEQKKIYNLVFDAQRAAIEIIASGMKCSEIFQSAMDVFKKTGYSDKFIHSLGHGVGLEVHETPRLSHNIGSVLKKDTVVTVEPGLYIPGWGGIRIEDMVSVTDNGCLNLTHSDKTLIEL
ncbi:M24 family metallopeptidase [Candidatus Latescibacterota bacterium]